MNRQLSKLLAAAILSPILLFAAPAQVLAEISLYYNSGGGLNKYYRQHTPYRNSHKAYTYSKPYYGYGYYNQPRYGYYASRPHLQRKYDDHRQHKYDRHRNHHRHERQHRNRNDQYRKKFRHYRD